MARKFTLNCQNELEVRTEKKCTISELKCWKVILLKQEVKTVDREEKRFGMWKCPMTCRRDL
jgi:hypothetical protein